MGRMVPHNGTQELGRPCQRPRAWLCDEYREMRGSATATRTAKDESPLIMDRATYMVLVPCPMRPSSPHCLVARGSYNGPVNS